MLKPEKEFKDYLKKTLIYWLLGVLIFSLIFLILNSGIFEKIKAKLSKAQIFEFPKQEIFKIPTKVESFYYIKEPIKKEIENLKEGVENFIEKVTDVGQKVENNFQKIKKKVESIVENKEKFENLSIILKKEDSLGFYIKKSNYEALNVDWGDGEKENIKINDDLTIYHKWNLKGNFLVTFEFLKGQKVKEKYLFYILVK